MKGYIKNFLDSKAYGFIRGDDNKDYFFHKNNVLNGYKDLIKDNAIVSFEPSLSKKGYVALDIKIEEKNIQDTYNYVTPNEVYISKNSSIKGWETVEMCDYILIGTSEQSPDMAKQDIINSAENIGANALLNFEYFKTTGSKPGTGKGTYYFTIHNFRASPVNIAKKSNTGTQLLTEVRNGLAEYAELCYTQSVELTRKSTIRMLIIWTCIICLLLLFARFDLLNNAGLNEYFIGIVAVILGFIFGRRTDYSYWIKKA